MRLPADCLIQRRRRNPTLTSVQGMRLGYARMMDNSGISRAEFNRLVKAEIRKGNPGPMDFFIAATRVVKKHSPARQECGCDQGKYDHPGAPAHRGEACYFCSGKGWYTPEDVVRSGWWQAFAQQRSEDSEEERMLRGRRNPSRRRSCPDCRIIRGVCPRCSQSSDEFRVDVWNDRVADLMNEGLSEDAAMGQADQEWFAEEAQGERIYAAQQRKFGRQGIMRAASLFRRRRNSDEEVRALERAAQLGDPGARERLAAAQRREGTLSGVVRDKPFWLIKVTDRKGRLLLETTRDYGPYDESAGWSRRPGEVPTEVWQFAWYEIKRNTNSGPWQRVLEKDGNVVAVWLSREASPGVFAVPKGAPHRYAMRMRKLRYPGSVHAGIAGSPGASSYFSEDLVGLGDYRPKKVIQNPLLDLEAHQLAARMRELAGYLRGPLSPVVRASVESEVRTLDHVLSSYSARGTWREAAGQIARGRNPGPKLPRFDARRGVWVGGDSRTLYAYTDHRTGSVSIHPGATSPSRVAINAAGPPEGSVRVATRAEAEAGWQSPLHPGWKVNPLPFVPIVPTLATGALTAVGYEGLGKPVARRICRNPILPALVEGAAAGVGFGAVSHAVGRLGRRENPALMLVGNPDLADAAEAWARSRGLRVPARGSAAWGGMYAAWQRGGMRKGNPLLGATASLMLVGNPGRKARRSNPRRRNYAEADGEGFKMILPEDKVLGTMTLAQARSRWGSQIQRGIASFRDFHGGAEPSDDVIVYDDGSDDVRIGWVGGRSPEVTYGGARTDVPDGSVKSDALYVHKTNDPKENGGRDAPTYLVGLVPKRAPVGSAPLTRDFMLIGSMVAKKGWLQE